MRPINDSVSELFFVEYPEKNSEENKVRYEIDYVSGELTGLFEDTKYSEVSNMINYYEELTEWSNWAAIIHGSDCNKSNTYELLKYYENLLSCDRDALFFKKIRSAIDIYYNEYNCESLTIESSIRALVQLIRYAPELSKKKDAQVYYDSKLECFGVIYKQTKKKKGTLNIIIKENNEIMFSLARKMTGVIRFTGKAYIGDSLDNSRGIKALFRMMDW